MDEDEPTDLDIQSSLPTIQEQISTGTSPLDLATGNEKVIQYRMITCCLQK